MGTVGGEVVEGGLGIDGLPQHDDVEHDAEGVELVFLAHLVVLAELATVAVEYVAGQAVSGFAVTARSRGPVDLDSLGLLCMRTHVIQTSEARARAARAARMRTYEHDARVAEPTIGSPVHWARPAGYDVAPARVAQRGCGSAQAAHDDPAW